MTQRRIDVFLWAIAIASALLIAVANDDPWARDWVCSLWCPPAPGGHAAFFIKPVYDIAVAAFTGVIFYWLLVRLPAYVQRKRIQRGLLKHYDAFRRELVTQLVFASGEPSADYGVLQSLTDPLACKDYFDRDSGRRWYAATNAIDDSETTYLGAIRVAVLELKGEIEFMVDHVDLDDDTYEFFKRGLLILGGIGRTRPEYDDVKSLMASLYELLTGWSFAGGKAGHDYIREGIERL